MSKVIVITGTSGAGKSTLIKKILQHKNVSLSISYTTRERRNNEINHIDYHFVSTHEFLEMKKRGVFYETTFYDNHYYGTSKSELSKNEYVIVDCDIVGAMKFNEFKCVKIFIYSSKNVIFERLMQRYKDRNKVEQRLMSYEKDMEAFKKGCYDYAIHTNDINKNVKELEKIIFNQVEYRGLHGIVQ